MRNYGIEILRMILCFWVVLFHYLKEFDYVFLLKLKQKMFHVPSFFFISFFFLFPIIRTKNTKQMILRLERLMIPYLGWPIIVWSLHNIFSLLFKNLLYGHLISFGKLIKQLIVGRIFMVQLWFLFNLLFFTISLFILSFLLDIKKIIAITQLIAILSYFLQYSKYNYLFFDQYKDSVSHSVGHFVESFPIASTAFIFNFTDVLGKLKSLRILAIFYCIIFNFFIYNYCIFMNIELYGKKYNYNGFDKNLFAIFSFVCFYLIPFEKLHSQILNKIIKIITKYTLGIYCIHTKIIFLMRKFFHTKSSFKGCIIIYFVSYLTSFIGDKLSRNTILKFLFV